MGNILDTETLTINVIPENRKRDWVFLSLTQPNIVIYIVCCCIFLPCIHVVSSGMLGLKFLRLHTLQGFLVIVLPNSFLLYVLRDSDVLVSTVNPITKT